MDGGSGSIGLYQCLLALAVVCLLPVIVLSGLAIWQAGQTYKDTAIKRLNDMSRTLANAVEGEIEGRFATLSARASVSSQAFQEDRPMISAAELAKISIEGQIDVVKAQDIAAFSLRIDPVNDAARDAIAGQVPVISNMLFNPEANGYRISLALPIVGGQGKQAAMVLTTAPDQLIRTLQQRSSSLSDILVAVVDGNGRIIARSRDPERFVGRRATNWFELQAQKAKSGLIDAATTDGVSMIFSFQKLSGTPGWTLVVGEPTSVFNAHWRDPMLALMIGAIVAWGLATVAAVWVGRLILRPVQALAAHNAAIASGITSDTPSPIPASPIREFERLRLSTEAAEKTLRDNERLYRTITEAGTLVLWRWTTDGDLVSARGWEQLTGIPDREALGTAWLDRAHPDDRQRIIQTFFRTINARGTVDMEFRLKSRDGRWLWVRDRGAPIFDRDGNPIEWVGVLEDIDARKQTEARIAHMAHHDALTGLGNRVLARERLELAIAGVAQGAASALLSIDLDRFKEANDMFGHPVGDALLRVVADRLRACAGETDFIARVGGDEFTIIQHDNADPESAAALAHRIIDTISAPYTIDGQRIVIGASVGIALISDTKIHPEGYLKRADQALYRAKEAGRGQASFFEQEHLVAEMVSLLTTPGARPMPRKRTGLA
jgi:diguanylate cyclase (GGDEF)-like protein/PAS domain S-box-containing protein